MSQVPRASATNLEQTARSVNSLRDLLQQHLRAPAAMPSPQAGLTTQEVNELIASALDEFRLTVQVDVQPLQVANSVYQGSQFFYTSHDDGYGGYVANRFYIDSEEEGQNDVLLGSGSAPLTLLEFQALAWPVPVP